MANDIIITVKGQDNATATFDNVKRSAGGLGDTLSRVGAIAGGIVIGQGLTKLPGLLIGAVQAAADDEQSMNKLKQAVNNTGVSYDSLAESLKGTIDLAQKRAFTDDQARDALSLLTAQTGSASEAQKRFGLAMDLARGANIDVVTASKLLGKVTDENVNVLARYGIKVQEGATETELFGAVQQRFGGQSEAFANSTAGHFEQVKIQMGELKERIGYQLLPVMTALGEFLVNDFIPAINDMADFFDTKVKPAIKDVAEAVGPELQGAFLQLKQTWEGLQPAIKAVGEALQPVIQFFKDHKEATIALVAALLLVTAPILAIIAAGVLLLAHWDEIRAAIDTQIQKFTEIKDKILELPMVGPIVQAAFDAIVLTITSAFEYLIAYIQTQIDLIKGIFKLGLDLIHGDFGQFWTDLKALFGTMFEDIKGLIGIQLGYVKELFFLAVQAWAQVMLDQLNLMYDAGTKLAGGILQGANSMVGYIARFFSELPGNFLGWMGDLGGILWDAGKRIMQGLLDGLESKWGAIKNFFSDLTDAITGWKGPPERDRALLLQAGKDIMQGLKDGLSRGSLTIQEALEKFTNWLGTIVDDPELYQKFKQAGADLIGAFQEGMDSAPPPVIPAPTPPGGGGGGGGGHPSGGGGGGGGGGSGAIIQTSQLLNLGQLVEVAALLGTNKGVIGGLNPSTVARYLNAAFNSVQGIFNSLLQLNPLHNTRSTLTYDSRRIAELFRPYGLAFDKGGWLMPGVTLAVNQTGRPERILGPHEGGMTVNLTYAPTFSSASSVEAQKFLRWIADGLRPIWGRATA